MSEVAANVNVEKVEASVISEKYLTFYIEDTIYGIAIENVIEIIGVEKTTVVPGIPHYIKGVINLRGRIVPIIDARLKIGKFEKEYDERTCIIVINWKDTMVGLIVDSVADVSDFNNDQLSKLPDFADVNSNGYLSSVCKIGDKLVLIFDCDKLLSDD